MTIEELYGKVLADDGLKEELAKAASDGKIAEWAAAQGVDATEDELKAYAKSMVDSNNEKLAVEDVDQVAGGGYGKIFSSVAKLGAGCLYDEKYVDVADGLMDLYDWING